MFKAWLTQTDAHLYSLVMLCFFIAVVFGKVYFSYIYAKRKGDFIFEPIRIDGQERFNVEINKKLYVAAWLIIITGLLIIAFPMLNKYPEKSEGIALLIDILVMSLFVIPIALIKLMRSFVIIDTDHFYYRGLFRIRPFRAQDITAVYKTTGFTFVKIKSRKIPLIIEHIYTENERLYTLLNNLMNSKSTI